MPVLTEEELQKLKDKASKAEKNLKATQANQKQLQEDVEDAKTKKKGFLIGFIICLVLLIISLVIFFNSPETLGIETNSLAADEVVVKKSEIENYKASIAQLEKDLAAQHTSHPLDLNAFYAVQLGAFKKFNTRLSSDSYNIVRNANYQDFNLFTLGVFETEAEAEELRKVVKQLNFKDAFVGKYENGERVDAQF
ncbi:SPOR domain-containing protein [Psychroflexus salis]|uniref:SPOR domain-containing protein n=1 Tax=Psychroflexus salis TaxID=1526574 RepID=A0A917E7I3_9FLAO|nr:SPOR domain-containing protein [Psychroflexus salis]GGE12552.1 hypothetical protein GCM10010831_12460 [Psychroflexus salis]